MSIELLFREFERISEAPGANVRLPRFVLDLAVRGRLTHRDPSDEPASQLLHKLERKLVESPRPYVRRKATPTAPLEAGEVPFPVPEGWIWTRIRQVTKDHGQAAPSSEFTYIDVTAINKESGRIREPIVLAASDAPSRARKIVKFGDVLYSCVRPYLLNVAVVDIAMEPPPIASTAFAVLDGLGLVAPRYLWTVLRSSYFVGCVEEKMRGQAYPAINDSDFALLPIPLPPLAEQHRIVAKVDELMLLCDQLERTQKEREIRRDGLRSALLQRLTSTEGAGTGESADARFFLDWSPRLITNPKHVAAIRQTIFDMAVRGRLVRQDPQDAPTFAERVDTDGAQFPLPASWSWLPISRIGNARLGKMLDKAKNRGVPRRYLRNVNVRWFDIDLADLKVMPFEDDELEEFGLLPGDVLICEGGEPGRAAVWDGRENDLYFQKALHRVRLFEWMAPQFLVLYLRSSADAGRLVPYSTGATFHHLTGQSLARLLVPIPPVAEQHRIVAKVDELMVLCDDLELALASAQDGRDRVLDTLLREALQHASAPLVEAGPGEGGPAGFL